MKDFFSSKLNIFLSVLLLAIISVCVWFAFTLFGNPFDKSIVAVNFSGMNKTEVEKWIDDNKLDKSKYNYSFQYDEVIEQNYVVYQSVKEGEKINDSLTIVYSNGKDPSGAKDVASEIKNMSADEARKWFLVNEYTNVSFLYQISDVQEFGKLISVNPSNATKSDNITVTYSLGKSIEDIVTTVPNFSTYTELEIREWAKQHAIDLSIKFEEHDIAKEGEFISQSIPANKEIKGGQSLIVTLSSGKGDGNSKTIPDSYLGLSESDFISKLKALGFKNLSKSNTTYYAESIEKGNIYSYDDGSFSTSRTINYALSEGKYIFDAKEFNDKTKTDAEKVAANLKNRNARIDSKLITIEFVAGDKNDDKTGKTYDCAASKNAISCKVYSSDNSAKALIPTNNQYLGKDPQTYIDACKKLGFTNFKKLDTTYFSTTLKKDTLYSYDDGELSLGKTLEYALSAGPYSFNANDFNGLTKDEASKKASDLKARNARINGDLITISFAKGTSSSVGTGKVFDCTANKNNISCKVNGESSSTGKTATIPGTYLKLTEADLLSKLKALGFNNVSKLEPSKFSETINEGCIWEYEDGTFDTSKTITYRLSAGKYSFNANEFNGISKDDATNKANAYKNRNAAQGRLSISFTNGEANSSSAGKTYGCSYSSSTISCKVYTSGGSTNTQVSVSNYTGKSLNDFKTWCSNNGLNVSVTETSSDSVASGNIISQNPASGSVDKGSTISVTVSTGKAPVKNADMLSLSFITQNYKGDNFDDTKNKVVSYLNGQGFSNVSVQETTSTKPLYSIVSITVNGTNHSGQASYPVDSTIVVTIVSKNSIS